MSSSRDFRDLDGADPWKLLGVTRSAGAEEIKRSYRRLSRSHHTDVGGDSTQQVKLNRAYEILTDPTRRADYALLLQRKERPQDFVRPTRPTEPEPDEPSADPFDWASGPGPTSTPPRQDTYDQAYRDPYTESPYADPPHRDSYTTPPDGDSYTAPTYRTQRRGGVSGQAVGALLTAFICSPISIYLAISVLRNNRPGRPLAWLAILINVGLLGFSIFGGLLRGT
ncbi:DnaJ-like protein [Kribbella pratensis]|uniref:DnaJ-like protein n=1 Tax=Kribbella pratensis TaxID=2512112 RepID=A0ABY2FAX3_9ACTN|nr:J domain-containing protein [Kribbella pratensis]TDW87416.1 DnaJ-like protein [Kribbella pratensis]